MKNKKSIFKKISCVLGALAISFVSIFACVQKNGRNQSLIASADYTTSSDITFNSSDIIYSRISNSSIAVTSFFDLLYDNAINPSSAADFEFFKWNFQISLNSTNPASNGSPILSLKIKGSNYSNFALYSSNETDFAVSEFISLNSSIIGGSSFSGMPISSFQSNKLEFFQRDVIVGNASNHKMSLIGYAVYRPDTSSIPSLVMSTIELGNYSDFSFFGDFSLPVEYSYSNIICYTDTMGWKFMFLIPTWYSYSTQPESYLTYRKYYTGVDFDLSDDQIYLQGYNQGLADNQSTIYDNGYIAGYDTGYGVGRNDGIASANNYSFLGLIGAVIDAPINAFTSLFNFEFMGFNLLNFITSLITLALIIWLIKLIFGGK